MRPSALALQTPKAPQVPPAPWVAHRAVGASRGRLGLRRPELFRSLATVARRVGIWTFADEEAAALLEGFSRGRLIDEVLFQEARLHAHGARLLAHAACLPGHRSSACLSPVTSGLHRRTKNEFDALGNGIPERTKFPAEESREWHNEVRLVAPCRRDQLSSKSNARDPIS